MAGLPALPWLAFQAQRRSEVQPKGLARVKPHQDPTRAAQRLVPVQRFRVADCVLKLTEAVWFLECGRATKWVQSVSLAVPAEQQASEPAGRPVGLRPVSAQRQQMVEIA